VDALAVTRKKGEAHRTDLPKDYKYTDTSIVQGFQGIERGRYEGQGEGVG